MSRKTKILIGSLLGILLLALSLRGVDGGKVWAAILEASIPLIGASILLGVFAHNVVRALRWRVLLSEEKRGIGLYNLFSTTMIGYAVSWALPLRLGEILRPILLAEREGIRVSAALTTVVIERFLDGLSVVFLFALALTVWDGRGGIGEDGERILGYARTGGVAMMVGGAGLFAALLGASATRRLWEPRVEAFAARTRMPLLAGAARSVVGIVEGGAILRRPLRLTAVVLLSLLTWIVIGGSIWVGLAAGGVRLGFLEIFVLLPASVLGVAVPTPGGAGSFEFAVSGALTTLFGQPKDLAYAATLVLHVAIMLVPVVLVGLVLLWKDGISFGRLKSALAAAGEAGR